MKKRIGYLMLVVIAILGSRLLYGINYNLNNNAKIEENLYKYNITDEELLDVKLDNNYIYYITNNKNKYSFIKYDLVNNKKNKEYNFISSEKLSGTKIFKKNNYWYLIFLNNNTYYQFNKNLDLINTVKNKSDYNYSYGIYNNDLFSILENKIYYKNYLYDELPLNCGNLSETIYSDNVYIQFYNHSKNLGCLYNMNNKNIYYLDYENIDIASSKYLEYQNNSLKFRYNNETYYLNDITENNNLKMHKNSDYLFTYDDANNYLRIYNLDTRRIMYEKKLENLKNLKVSNIGIDDYAYFIVKDKYHTYIYIWDYLKDNRLNKEMILQNEKEYKFKNDRLISQIKETYNIDIFIYDNAVKYFDDIYVIPLYDEILINSRLNTLKKLLDKINYQNDQKINILFEKEIFWIDNKENSSTYTTYIDDKYSIVIKLTDNNFDENILNLIN